MGFKKFLSLLIAPAFAFGLAACDVDQTEEGDLPDVEVEEGELPSYDVEGPEVEVTEDTVTVPDVDVNAPDEDIDETEIDPNN
ncbi:MAG TPA: hypothetical protein VK966_03205 [Longimicrobiales bacterium]|nr:hypothetical protein [Longimicrobiales bacterium]